MTPPTCSPTCPGPTGSSSAAADSTSLDAAWDALAPGGRLVATFAAVDRAAEAHRRLGSLVQVAVDRAETLPDGGVRFAADNPVFVAWGDRPAAADSEPATLAVIVGIGCSTTATAEDVSAAIDDALIDAATAWPGRAVRRGRHHRPSGRASGDRRRRTRRRPAGGDVPGGAPRHGRRAEPEPGAGRRRRHPIGGRGGRAAGRRTRRPARRHQAAPCRRSPPPSRTGERPRRSAPGASPSSGSVPGDAAHRTPAAVTRRPGRRRRRRLPRLRRVGRRPPAVPTSGWSASPWARRPSGPRPPSRWPGPAGGWRSCRPAIPACSGWPPPCWRCSPPRPRATARSTSRSFPA